MQEVKALFPLPHPHSPGDHVWWQLGTRFSQQLGLPSTLLSHKQTQHLLKYIPYLLSFSELPIMKELSSQVIYTFIISHSFFNSVILCSTLLKLLSLKTPMPTQLPNSGTFLLSFCQTWHGCTPRTLASWSPFPPCLLGQHSSDSSPITNGYSSVPLPHLTCLSHVRVPQTSTPASAFFSSTCLFVFLSTLLVSTITYVTGFLFLRWTQFLVTPLWRKRRTRWKVVGSKAKLIELQ